MPVAASTPIDLIQSVYATLDERVATGRAHFGRALTLGQCSAELRGRQEFLGG